MSLSLSLLCLGLIGLPMFAQRAYPPQKKTFENGLTVVTQKDTSSGVTALEILIKGGKKSEPVGQEGIAFLAARLALEIPDQGSIRDVMEKSARTMAAVKGDYAVIHLECLSDFLDPTLKIFAGILKDPLFSGLRIDALKSFMTDQRKIESDDNLNLGHLALLRTFFRTPGYAGSAFGEDASLKKLRSRDIEAYYETHFIPDNMVLVAVSDLDRDKLEEILKKYFGSLKPNKTPSPTQQNPAEAAERVPETILEKDTAQALVSLGYALPNLTPKAYTLAILAECLLGKGPGARLWPLRTEKKLAYNVNAKATIMKDGGLFEAYLETDQAKRERARAALTMVLRDIRENGVSAEELQDAKTFARTDFLRTQEPKGKRVETLGLFEILGLGVDYFVRFSEKLNEITIDAMNSFLRETFDPAKVALVIVGRKIGAGQAP